MLALSADKLGDAGYGLGSSSVATVGLKLRHHRAYWRGTRVELTIGEFKVLRDLFTHAGIDRTYRQLYDAVRGEGFVAGSGPEGYRVNVRNYITRVRKKFRDVDPEFDGIKNYFAFGYRWSDDRPAAGSYVLREVG